MQDARWLDRLERKLGGFSIPGLASFLAGMSGLVGLLSLLQPDFPARLTLNPFLILQGEVWRAVTFLFIPPHDHPFFLILWVFVFYAALRSLEDAWGDFKLTVFWGMGALATTAAALLTGYHLSNVPLIFSSYMAFARLHPRQLVFVFYVLPVEVRWLARIGWLLIAWTFVTGGTGIRVALLAGLLNYLLFFGRGHWRDLKDLLASRR